MEGGEGGILGVAGEGGWGGRGRRQRRWNRSSSSSSSFVVDVGGRCGGSGQERGRPGFVCKGTGWMVGPVRGLQEQQLGAAEEALAVGASAGMGDSGEGTDVWRGGS